MSRTERPGPAYPSGTRVVLLAPRSEPGKATAAALADIARLGWILAAMVEPDRFLDAMRMVLGGLVDLVVVANPEDLPHILTGPDLAAYGTPGRAGDGRTHMLPRPDGSSPSRRPQPVDRGDSSAEIRRRDTGFEPEKREPLTGIPPRAAESGANAGSQFGTQVPRRRASDRRSRVGSGNRRRH